MRTRFLKTKLLLRVAIIAILYILMIVFVVEALSFFGINSEERKNYFYISNIATIMAGAVTAGTLLSLVYSAKNSSDSERKSIISAALKANELHAEFNTLDMWKCRGLAWRYLTNINRNDTEAEKCARSWILDDGKMPRVDGDRSPLTSELDEVTYERESDRIDRSVYCVIGFYVRLYSYILSYTNISVLDDNQIKSIIGPFWWGYWRTCLIPLVNKCEQVYNLHAVTSYEKPFFIDQLKNLDGLYTRIYKDA